MPPSGPKLSFCVTSVPEAGIALPAATAGPVLAVGAPVSLRFAYPNEKGTVAAAVTGAMETPARILHFSDIHFRAGTQWDSDPVLRALSRFIAAEVADGLAPDLVAITGDLGFAGTAEEYALARIWLDQELWPRLAPTSSRPLPRDRLLLVPGNHDVDRGEVDTVSRMVQDGLLGGADQGQVATVLGDETQRAVLLKRHAHYLAFLGAWLGTHQSLPWWQRLVPIRNQRLHVAGLDSAWMACGNSDRGRLLLGRWQIHQVVDTRDAEGADWRIALLHHPWDYLSEFDGGEARQAIHLHRDLVLRGHLHEGEASLIRPPDPARACLELAAGCIYESSRYANAFQWIELYREPKRVRVLFRVWNKGAWQVDRNQPGCPEGETEIAMDQSGSEGSDMSGRKKAPSARRRSRGGEPVQEGSMAAPPDVSPKRSVRQCDVLLLYVNDKEREAIVNTFKGPRGALPKPKTIRGLPCLDLRTINGRRVLAIATNMGSATPGGSATLAHDAITKLNPEWIIAVGVAFGMDPEKTPIGTVLVSDRVSSYEPQRVGRTKTIHRGDTVSVHPLLKQHLQTVSSPPYWNGAEVRFGEILSGEKLIDQPGFKGKLRKTYPEAIGGEMEAAGIYSAAMLERRDWIVVKGVCDYADGHKGEDKDAHQRLAAGNAAAFVRHCLASYGAVDGISPSLQTADIETPAVSTPRRKAQGWTPRIPLTNPVHTDALAGIADSLDLVPALRDALAARIPGAKSDTSAELADRLCAGEANGFTDAMSHLRGALDEARRLTRERQGDIEELRNRAHDILGWMVVTTVMDGYDAEEAPAVRAWLDGAAIHVPIGRSVCLEVLSARWLKRRARFGLDRTRGQTGEDDITPERWGEIGFDDPRRIEQGKVVNEVWRLVYKKIDRCGTAPLVVDDETRDRLRKRLEIRFKEERRRLRLVVDPVDLRNPINMAAALLAIGQAIPRLHLIVVGPKAEAAGDIFLLSAGELAGDIEECLAKIDSLQGPPGSRAFA